MPTQIIDGFNLNANKPIDSRMVTNGLPSRNAIQYKYEGLRVYDIVDKTGYVWINGAWATDGGTGGGGGGGGTINTVGIPDYIAKFDTSGLTQSVIRETKIGQNGFVGIGVASALGKYRLEVGGTVYATSFAGPANSINGTMIETASLDPNKIVPRPNDGNTYLLKCVNGANQWTLDAGSAAIDITNDTDDVVGYLTFTDFATGDTGKNKTLKVSIVDSDTGLAVKPSTGQILGSIGSDPAYAFLNQTTTGLYRDSLEIGLKLSGNKVLSSDGTTVSLFSGSTSTFEISSAAAAIKTNTSITGTLVVSGNSTIGGTFEVTGETTLNSKLTVYADAEVNTGSLVVTAKSDTTGFSVTSTKSTSPPNQFQNTTGTGLYIQSTGEGLRLDTYTAQQVNFISFFGNGNGKTKASGSATDRRGWLGFGSQNSDTFFVHNEVGNTLISTVNGDINLKANLDVTFEPGGDTWVKSRLLVDNDVVVSGDSVTVGQYIKLRDYGKDPGAPAFFGRYTTDQDTGDAWIRVDSVADSPNWTGYYTFGVNGKFTAPRLQVGGHDIVRGIRTGNFIVVPGSVATQVVNQGDIVVTNVQYNTWTQVVQVTFGSAFPERPIVVASRSQYDDGTSNLPSGSAYEYPITVYDVTTTGFKVSVTRNDGSTWPTNGWYIRVSFIAICRQT